MEVNNPMMDQLLVNAAAQTPASQSAKPQDGAERPDFDSMVHQKRSAGEKPEAKSSKAAKAEKGKAAEDEAPEAQEPAADERYAIAAAMMFQAQPDMRVAALQPELVAAENEITVSAVLTTDAETQAEQPEPQIELSETAGLPVEAAAEDAPEQAELPREPIPMPEAVETPAQPRREALVEAEARPEAGERPGKTQEQPEDAPRSAQPEAPRAERAPERAPRGMRVEERPETEDDVAAGDAQAMQATPLFERVDAPVVKVAEASRPIPLEAENGVEELGNELGGILVNSADANRVEITLTPEHLGRLTVEITRGTDGALSVVLHPTTERAANLLERGANNLQNLLAANRANDVQVQVRPSENAQQQQQNLNPDGQNQQGRQQQQRNGREPERRNARDFLQQLRLGLVDADGSEQ